MAGTMTFAELVVVGVAFVIGYVLGTVYPLWQPEEKDDIEEDESK